MENRIRSSSPGEAIKEGGPQPICRILAELLRQYQARFPELRVTVVKEPVRA